MFPPWPHPSLSQPSPDGLHLCWPTEVRAGEHLGPRPINLTAALMPEHIYGPVSSRPHLLAVSAFFNFQLPYFLVTN